MLYLLIGLTAGILSGLFGIGGGVIIIPSLLLLAKMQPATATGTSLGAMLLPVGILGAIQYYRKGDLQVSVAILLALGLLIGAGLGANLALRLSSRALQRAFAVFLAGVAVQVWWRA
jgi:hypothetical protein